MKAKWFLILLFCCAAAPVSAEEIRLKNGDRISGTVIERTDTTLTVATEAMGRIVVNQAFVAGLEEQSAPAPEEPAPEKSPSPWQRQIAVGYNQTGGNTETGQGNVSLSASRKAAVSEWTGQWDAYYSSTDRRMDARKFYGMGRYARRLGPARQWYNFYELEGDQDRQAAIAYRLVPSAGAGYWFADNEVWKTMAETAFGWEYTNFSNAEKSSRKPVLIPRASVERVWANGLKTGQGLVIYPSLQDLGEYRVHSESTVKRAISETLAWKISFIDDFNSHPAADTKRTDYRLISALDYTF